jgi:uncharacterized membrane-anchored protein YitT (DUF2179 family)
MEVDNMKLLKKQFKKKKFFKNFFKGWKDYIWIIFGSLLTAAAINVFLVPYKIAPGGVSGIATVIYYLSGSKFPVGTTMLVLNIPLFILGLRFIGKRFAFRTLFSTIFLSAAIDTTEPFTKIFIQKYLVTLDRVPSSPDLLLYAITGGALMGIGLGMVFKFGATTGGSDLAARIVNHFQRNFTMGQILLSIDTAAIIFAAISFNSFLLALYAVISLFVSSKVIDAVLEGVNFAKAVFIISDKPDEIAARILKEIDRGITALKGKGMYTGFDKQVLLCVLHRGQLPVLKLIVKEVDEKAFVILTDIREVFGEGFKTYDS